VGGAVSSCPGSISKLGRRRLALQTMQVSLVLVVGTAVVLVAPRLTPTMNDVVTYAAWAAVLLAAGVAALMRGRLAEERMKLRWMLMGLWLCGGALQYLIASAVNYNPLLHTLDPLSLIVGTMGSAAMLLSITVSFTGASREIILLDVGQTLLYMVLAALVNYATNPWAKDAQSHILISLVLTMIGFLTAAVAPLSAATHEEHRFFTIIAVYLGASWVTRFITSEVGYVWMHDRGNFYTLPAIGVCLALALFLMHDVLQSADDPKPDSELEMRRLMMRNLMPSLFALGSFVIALYVFFHAPWAGLPAVLCAVGLYAWRTLLLEGQMTREAAVLLQRNAQLEVISHRDPLTGAGNRRSLSACFEQCRAERSVAERASWMTVMLVDLDYFKEANDLLGHQYGDRLLQQVADLLLAACAEVVGSHVSRFGGDEFALLLPRMNADEASKVAETVRSGVLALRGDGCAISASIGVVSTQMAGSLDEQIRLADVALYRAKLRGRNRAEFEGRDLAPSEETASRTLGSLPEAACG
jgi:diguanylate cyclase (GGDEF)-like protein